ncbi:MAG: hypothetical protein MZV70_05235 [Desulfobacterales bacterium]|nr:hypothetical protein [Desulfobacterales bacterium]
MIFHEYRVDRDGIVTELKVLDTATANNALRCLVAQRIAESGIVRHPPVRKPRAAWRLDCFRSEDRDLSPIGSRP